MPTKCELDTPFPAVEVARRANADLDSPFEATADDPLEVEADYIAHLLLTAWALVLDQERAPGDSAHPTDPLDREGEPTNVPRDRRSSV